MLTNTCDADHSILLPKEERLTECIRFLLLPSKNPTWISRGYNHGVGGCAPFWKLQRRVCLLALFRFWSLSTSPQIWILSAFLHWCSSLHLQSQQCRTPWPVSHSHVSLSLERQPEDLTFSLSENQFSIWVQMPCGECTFYSNGNNTTEVEPIGYLPQFSFLCCVAAFQGGWDWVEAEALTTEISARKIHTDRSTNESFHHYYINVSTIGNRNVKFVYEINDQLRDKFQTQFFCIPCILKLIQYSGRPIYLFIFVPG